MSVTSRSAPAEAIKTIVIVCRTDPGRCSNRYGESVCSASGHTRIIEHSHSHLTHRHAGVGDETVPL